MKYCLVIVLLFFSYFVLSQNRLSKEQACADIDYYFAKIDSIHPNMYWHTPKSRVDSFKIVLKEKCKDSISVEEFSFLLSEGNCFFDSHTGHQELWNECYLKNCDSIYPQTLAFPLVNIQIDGVFLHRNGWEILSINQHPVSEILEKVRKHFGVDIPVEAMYMRASVLRLWFQQVIMAMGIDAPYEVIALNEHRDTVKYIEPGTDYWAMKYDRNEFLAEFFNDSDYVLKCDSVSSVAILYLYSSSLDQAAVLNFDKFLASCFEELKAKQIRNLFIDISRNSGGTTEINPFFFKYLSNDKSFYGKNGWKEKVLTKKNRLKVKSVRYRSRLPKQKGYDGNVFIYQSYLSHSAATDVSRLFRVLNRGILVGTHTERLEHNYCSLKRFKLPYSHLPAAASTRYFFSWSKFFSRSRILRVNSGDGLDPDIPYPFLIERELDVSDCLKIIELNKLRKME